VEHAVMLMKLGAMDYLVKPLEMEQLELCAKRALAVSEKNIPLKQTLSTRRKKVKIIAGDKKIKDLLSLASRVADSSASVLIQGESGTGKELFARYIHEKSGRCDQPFVAVNCAALPENLLESELFGHEKGSFTGAISRKIGKFELAHQGTLFLDEITEMQFHLQSKLLRVLQEKVVDRVGGTEPVDVDVRVIATTNRDPEQAVENKNFRQDLFYRLNTIPLVIPPLRDRRGDLDILIRFFIQKYCKIDGRHVKGMTKEAITILNHHPFSGNVRELENIIHRAVLLARSDMIEPGDLLIHGGESQDDLPGPSVDKAVEAEPGSLKGMEQKMIFKTLDQTEGNRTHAAKILGISVRTLRNKLNEYKENN
jgi:two-component system response regulator FlrC